MTSPSRASLGIRPPRRFRLFTEEIDRWWRRPRSTAAVVGSVGGQLVSATGEGAEVLATVTVWEPPAMLEMVFAPASIFPGDRVSVTFETTPAGTRITVRQTRAGMVPGDAASAVVGYWWADLLAGLAGRGG